MLSLSLSMSLSLSLSLSMSLCVCLSLSLSLCLSVCLSLSLSLCVSLSVSPSLSLSWCWGKVRAPAWQEKLGFQLKGLFLPVAFQVAEPTGIEERVLRNDPAAADVEQRGCIIVRAEHHCIRSSASVATPRSQAAA